jgi:Ca2+:H+ antiporter
VGFDLRRFLLSGSGWPYLLVPFIPFAIALELSHASATVIFLTSALGVIPTAALMGRATEELAARSGPGFGGFLNVTFGNAPELINPARHGPPRCWSAGFRASASASTRPRPTCSR